MTNKYMTEHSIVVAGTLALDIVPVFDQSLLDERITAGGTVYLKRIDTLIGGSAGNTGLALHRLGADVTIYSRVGGDGLKAIVKKSIEDTGCKHIIEEDADMNTSASVIMAQPGCDRTICHSRGASQQYRAEDLPASLLSGASMMHFGYPTGMVCMFSDGGENLSALYKRAKGFGVTTSMDLSFPGINTPAGLSDWREIYRKTLPFVDVFLPSFEELLLTLHRDRYLELRNEHPDMKMKNIFDINLLRTMGQELIDFGVKIVVIKCGELGAYLRTTDLRMDDNLGRTAQGLDTIWWGREIFTSPFAATKIVSTNGAGDTFVGGFLHALLLGMRPENAMNLASAASYCRITSEKGRDGIPAWSEVFDIASSSEKYPCYVKDLDHWSLMEDSTVYEYID